MTVAVVLTALERGGAQRIALETAAELHTAERPVVLVTGRGGALADEARARLGARLLVEPALIRAFSPLPDARALIGLRRTLRRIARSGPLVVHTHSSKAGILGRAAAAFIDGARVVHTVHGFGTLALGERARPLLEDVERWAAARTDVLAFVSAHDLRVAAGLGLRPRQKSVVLRAGVDDDAVRDRVARLERGAARARFGLSPDDRVIVTVGNLKPQKDPLFHVEVLAALRAREPRARLLFIGDGPLRAAVEARARALGVDDALRLPGFVDDVTPTLAAADVMLLASRWEGLPCAVLEGLACGLPVVVRDTGYGRDLRFADGRLTALALSAAPPAFARALHDKLEMPRHPQSLPRAFTQAGMLEQTATLYDALAM